MSCDRPEADRSGDGVAGGDHLWFLENLDQVNRAIQGTSDIEQMMSDVLDTVLSVYGCDRAWLLYPCDPEVESVQVPMERTTPEYPGALEGGGTVPVDAEFAEDLRLYLEAGYPVATGFGAKEPGSSRVVPGFSIQSQLAVALFPNSSAPWLFGLHQCSRKREWSTREVDLFQEVGRRLSDALGMLRAARRLRDSEEQARLALDVANVGFWWHDLAVNVIHADQRSRECYGFHDGDVVVPDFIDHIHPDDLERVERAVVAAHDPAGDGNFAIEHRVIHPGGEVRWVAVRARTHFSGEGASRRAVRVMATVHDVTERKRAEEVIHASEQRFRTFVDHAADAVYLHGEDQRILDVSQQACDVLGYSRAELIGMSPLDFDVDMTAEELLGLKARLATGEVVVIDTRHRRKDGSIFPVEVRIRAFEEGGRFSAVSTAHDISKRLEAEASLKLFRTLLDHAKDSIEVIDLDTLSFIDVNQSACDMHGFTREEYLSKTVFDLDPDVALLDPLSLQRRLERPPESAFESRHIDASGRTFPVEVTMSRVQFDKPYLIAIVRDITERKRVDQELLLSQERMRLAVEATNIGYWDLDLKSGKVVNSPESARLVGYGAGELGETGDELRELIHPEDRSRLEQAARDCMSGETPDYVAEFRMRHKDGSCRWVLSRGAVVRDASDAPVRLIGCNVDITDRKRAEEALAESHTLLNAVVEGTSDLIYVKDRTGRYLMLNAAAARALGREKAEVIGKTVREILPSDEAESILADDAKVLALGTMLLSEEARIGRDGRAYLSTRSVYRAPDGAVLGTIEVARDITEFKRLEEELRQVQKMESIGRLAGGIAHDFNNLLTVINGNSELAFQHLDHEHPATGLITQIKEASARATALTGQLLSFGRKQVLRPRTVQLNGVLEQLLALLERVIGEDVEVDLVASAEASLVNVDPGQFEQAIINLAVNARDAMDGGGRLVIRTEDTELDRAEFPGCSETFSGCYVQVSVTDTGCGMEPSVLDHVFEPFFTTKPVHEGTGLGLSMVYGFVKQSGGHIVVDSAPGAGSTFRLYLPCSCDTASEIQPEPIAEVDPVGGTETILLVEDEDAVRLLARRVLEAKGYRVMEAQDGEEALSHVRQSHAQLDLVVTDVVMPKLTGTELVERLMESYPDLKTIFISGYADDAVDNCKLSDSQVAFLSKPFTSASLAAKVRDVLDSSY